MGENIIAFHIYCSLFSSFLHFSVSFHPSQLFLYCTVSFCSLSNPSLFCFLLYLFLSASINFFLSLYPSISFYTSLSFLPHPACPLHLFSATALGASNQFCFESSSTLITHILLHPTYSFQLLLTINFHS